MRILTFSTLYPNAGMPHRGVFVENRLRHLCASGRVEARVLAPAPWVPGLLRGCGAYADYAGVPDREERHGLRVDHPRYLVIPKIGMSAAPWLLYRGARAAVRRILDEGYAFDLIDAHYFYPDGVAAVMLGRHFGKPVVITARGTDINLIPRYTLPRRMIRWAAAQADGLVAVSQALKDRMVELGIAGEKIRFLRNGVDLNLFKPTADRTATRTRLDLNEPTMISVGNLVPLKGHDLVIQALASIPEARLLIVGQGPDKNVLERLARGLGVEDRVRFLGRIPHTKLPDIYAAADLLVLASSREGWANVLLEAMACGTPVVASSTGGTPEVVAEPEAGVLVRERSADALAAGIRQILANPPDRGATRAYAERFSWDDTTVGQLEIFHSVINRLKLRER